MKLVIHTIMDDQYHILDCDIHHSLIENITLCFNKIYDFPPVFCRCFTRYIHQDINIYQNLSDLSLQEYEILSII